MSAPRLSVVLALVMSAASAHAQSVVPQSVIASGGRHGTSTNFAVHGTLGQPIIGTSAGAQHQAFHGYWLRLPVSPVDVEDGSVQPVAFGLGQAYPNPAGPGTTIAFALPEETHVDLRVFDVTGAQVTELVNRPMQAGWHRVNLDARRFASGIYFYRLVASGFRGTGRVVVLR